MIEIAAGVDDPEEYQGTFAPPGDVYQRQMCCCDAAVTLHVTMGKISLRA